MPDLTTERGYKIPGGWQAWVPEIFADATYMRALTEALRPIEPEPEREARRRVQEVWEVEFLSRLKDFIKRNGDMYGKRWREKVGKDGTLQGFDPETLQTRYLPGSRSAGNKPKTNIINILQAMAMQ